MAEHYKVNSKKFGDIGNAIHYAKELSTKNKGDEVSVYGWHSYSDIRGGGHYTFVASFVMGKQTGKLKGVFNNGL